MPRRTKANSLRAFWSKKEKDIMFYWPSGPHTKTDGHFLYGRMSIGPFNYDGKLDTAFLKELEDRGYDLTTLLFSICKKEDHPRWKKDEPKKETLPETSGSND